MSDVFKMSIFDMQPSQLFISEQKLAKIQEWLNHETLESYNPIPVKELNGKIVMLDGHTRAFALHKMGIKELRVCWEQEEWDWEAYQVCVNWCLEEGITNVSGLEKKVVSHEDYEVVWYDKCRQMQKELEEKRALIDK
jgi:hypothetical protein